MMKTAFKNSVQSKDGSSTFSALKKAAHRCLMPMTEVLEGRTLFSVFTVINNNDSGAGSLRQAILASNATTGPNTINFNLPAGQTMIIPATLLPAVTTSTNMNGASQPGYLGKPVVWISGSLLPTLGTNNNALTITANNSTVTGLAITGVFGGSAIELDGNNDVVDTAFLGVDPSGGTDASFAGFAVANFLGVNVVGSNAVIKNSVLSNNFTSGAKITGNGATLTNDKIGTDVTGAVARGNLSDGVLVVGAANVNIGTSSSSGYGCSYGPAPVVFHNIISNNSGNGIRLLNAGSNVNIAGNYIGTDATGLFAMANFGNGIDISNTLTLGANAGIDIGGSSSSARNVIAANFGDAISIKDVSGTSIMGNFLGTDVTGRAVLSNFGNGVHVTGKSSGTSVGGWSNTGNLISGNFGDGVKFETDSTTTCNTISGNFIGTDLSGTIALGNFGNGVTASNNIQVGTYYGGNLISGNFGNGVELTGNYNTIAYNRIGLKFCGTTIGIGNGLNGVMVDGAHNVIGTPCASNIIAFNAGNGVTVGSSQADTGAIDNSIRGNSIFSDGGLGIDLGDDGEGTNSHGVHVGPDMDLNHPMLTSAVRSNGRVTIQGTFNGAATANFSIDLYANQYADPSGYGEGQYYLGTITIKTDANGNASFTVTLNDVPAGWSFVSATVTDSNGDTSEFSNNQLITNGSSSGGSCGSGNNNGGSCNNGGNNNNGCH